MAYFDTNLVPYNLDCFVKDWVEDHMGKSPIGECGQYGEHRTHAFSVTMLTFGLGEECDVLIDCLIQNTCNAWEMCLEGVILKDRITAQRGNNYGYIPRSFYS